MDFPAPATARNLVICCDGTSNTFGVTNTNVVRLAEVIDRSAGNQILYYDPGGAPSLSQAWSAR